MPRRQSKTKRKIQLSKPTLFIAAFIILLLALSVVLERRGVINLIEDNKPPVPELDEDINYGPPSEEQLRKMDEDKVDPNKYTEPGTIDESEPSSVTITQATQIDTNVVVQTQLIGQSWKSCELKLSKGSSIVIKTAETIYQSDHSICQGFAIPTSEFTESGEWNVILKAAKLSGSSFQSDPTKVTVTR